MEQPDRHLECSACKKPIEYFYTEVIGKTIYRVGMCHDCPILQKKLHGRPYGEIGQAGIEGKPQESSALCCGGCGLTQDEVRMGAPLGCTLCYEVFYDILLRELSQSNRIAIKPGTKKQSLYMGRRPGQLSVLNPALKLLDLHQALNETIKQEDYEQAAWLRDQIKALTDEQEPQKTEADE